MSTTDLRAHKLKSAINEEIAALTQAINVHITYLVQKLNDGDWHGVADAAMDIREYQAKIDSLSEMCGALDHEFDQ